MSYEVDSERLQILLKQAHARVRAHKAAMRSAYAPTNVIVTKVLDENFILAYPARREVGKLLREALHQTEEK